MARPYMKDSGSSTSNVHLMSGDTSTMDMASRLHRDDTGSQTSSVAGKYALPASPATWGTIVDMGIPEPDDFLHNPDPVRDKYTDKGGHIFTARGLMNLGCLFFLAAGLLALFAAFPIITTLLKKEPTTQGGFNIGGINATGQIPSITGNWGLIDKDTPAEAYTRTSYLSEDQGGDGEELVLVFSDEFNEDGRTFYPGDDPFWEAVDLHYWGTNDLEWYDPAQPHTQGGTLRIPIERVEPELNHDLEYRSGMLQSWNKFCFTGGIIEASVRLPGYSDVSGLWPGIWTMGNLGRAGYGGTNDGTWPFSYDSCDVGTLPNQTYPGTQTPAAALSGGDPSHGGVLSYLPGQKLSACTCPGEPHPGPARPDGTLVGRAAPEIDIIEATVEDGIGKVSLSAQWAPFNAGYNWLNSSTNLVIHDTAGTVLNSYKGGVYQQTTSGLANTNQDCYEMSGTRCFTRYGFDYTPGPNGQITWVNDNKLSWTLRGPGMAGDDLTEIKQRIVPTEPMYIILNLGISHNFAEIDLERLVFPATMEIDWLRVYQRKGSVNVGCDPKEFPTAAYIERYMHVYTNPNVTTWEQAGETWPKNRLMNGGTCD